MHTGMEFTGSDSAGPGTTGPGGTGPGHPGAAGAGPARGRRVAGAWIAAAALRTEVERAAAAAGVPLHGHAAPRMQPHQPESHPHPQPESQPQPQTRMQPADVGRETAEPTSGMALRGIGPDGDGAGFPAAPSESEWARCSVIVLDAPVAAAAVRAGLPRRDGVLIVTGGDGTDRGGATGVAPGTRGTGGDGGDGGERVWRLAVKLGAEQVVALPAQSGELMAALSRPAPGADAGGGGVIAVVAGHGGAGASVFASALALTAPLPSLLVDLDSAGAGLDLLLGIEGREGLRWPQLRLHGGRVDPEALQRGLPRRGCATVLASGARTDRGPDTAPDTLATAGAGQAPAWPAYSAADGAGDGAAMASRPSAVRSVLQVGIDGGMTVIADVSRDRSAAAAAAVEAADLTVLVTRADVPGCAAAVRAVPWLRAHSAATALVVRGPAPGGLRAVDVENALGIPLLTSMRAEPGLAKRMEHGGVSFARNSPLERASRTVHRIHRRRPEAGAA